MQSVDCDISHFKNNENHFAKVWTFFLQHVVETVTMSKNRGDELDRRDFVIISISSIEKTNEDFFVSNSSNVNLS